MPFEPIRDVPDRGDDRVGTYRTGFDHVGAELAGAAEEDSIRTLADEFDAVEIADDGVHRQRQHALALKEARRRGGDRLQLLVLEREAELPELLAELRPGAGRGVRHEPQPVAGPTE